jgi:hypothetical protein
VIGNTIIFKLLVGFGSYPILLLLNVLQSISEFIRETGESIQKQITHHNSLKKVCIVKETLEKFRKLGQRYNRYHV